jgi:predicted enzyme related to lactoylglutathione lyase
MASSLVGAVLYAKDLPGLVHFYVTTLGLGLRRSEADHAELDAGGVSFTLVQIPAAVAAQIVLSQPPQRREDTPIKLVFEVGSLAAARVAVAQGGGEMNPPEREWSWQGRTVCDGHDPEGNVFQLAVPDAVAPDQASPSQ